MTVVPGRTVTSVFIVLLNQSILMFANRVKSQGARKVWDTKRIGQPIYTFFFKYGSQGSNHVEIFEVPNC